MAAGPHRKVADSRPAVADGGDAALKLDYYSLKRRLADRRSPVGDTADSIPPPAFVELAPGPVPSLGPRMVEFSDGTGFTLRVQLPAGQVPDLAALGRSFWDGR
jgi:hypothetical protein